MCRVKFDYVTGKLLARSTIECCASTVRAAQSTTKWTARVGACRPSGQGDKVRLDSKPTQEDVPMGSKLVLVPNKGGDDEIQRAAIKSRYAMDETSRKLLKETGRRAAMKLFEFMNDNEKWDQVGPRNQIALLELALNRAFGRVETVTADEKIADDKDNVAGALPSHLRLLAGKLDLPELRGAKAATKVDGESD